MERAADNSKPAARIASSGINGNSRVATHIGAAPEGRCCVSRAEPDQNWGRNKKPLNGHLEQCSRAQVRVRSCFRLSSGLLFPPLLRLEHCRRFTVSCRGEPFQRHQAANVVGQVLQADLDARPHDANRAHDPTARRVLLRSEHMLDASAYPALGVVHCTCAKDSGWLCRPRR